MTQQDFSLAKVFSDLANDPNWPEQLMKLADQITGDIPIESKILRQLKLDKARLVLMVVEEKKMRLHSGAWLDWITKGKIGPSPSMMVTVDDALTELKINSDDYAKVKKRVEEAVD